MARKTGKTNDTEGMAVLIVVVGVLLFIPFLVVSYVSFSKLKEEYLEDGTAQRVMDIRRLLPTLIAGGAVCAIGAIIVACSMGDMNQNGFSFLSALVATFAALLAVVAGYYLARHLAVMYLGVVADKSKDTLIFPFDMQSYTIADYLGLRFLYDFCRVDSVPLGSIEKMTRGRRGKDLYIHGAFGSRGITMSNKQKRDECLAMIQSLTGKRGLLVGEVEAF